MGCDRDSYAAALQRRHSWLPPALARRYAHTYGARSERVIGTATSLEALGEHFGHGLYQAELRYLMEQEWVVAAEDALWRRTKLGMWLDDAQRQRVAEWLAAQRNA